ncbi:kinase-like domain-containing protein [Ilyonectria sp. MPI-CAGE-AT-0026]|nr:kinase-like domain-containing protein [Ilyonectria sp. MPI-CAGE-AT-0026]
MTSTTNEKPPSYSSSQTASDLVYKEIRAKLVPKLEPLDFSRQFLPLGNLEAILSEKVVDDIIAQTFSHPKIRGAPQGPIWGKRHAPRRIKILATLILIGKVEYLDYFCQKDIFDKDLPLPKPGDGASQTWEEHLVDLFSERQHVLLAPRFLLGVGEHHKFSHTQRLPFLTRLDWKYGGAHGRVSKVRIHDDHHSRGEAHLGSDEICFYAVKKFTNETHFKNERRALLRFSSPNKGHKHIIQLLLSYEVRNKYFMIFPCAKSNLARFWEDTPSNTKSGQDSHWLIEQCLGIAEALCKIHKHDSWKGNDHRDRGRHGDIKPENILFFKGPKTEHGLLTIADFTLMRFHSLDSVDKTAPKDVGFSWTYRPPEVDGGLEHGANQKHDVWSLGCVYLEFITWYLLGYYAIRGKYFEASNKGKVQTFSTLRVNDDGRDQDVPGDGFFMETDNSDFVVKDSVTKWIEMLRRNEHCSEAMDDFLNLIEDCMLVAHHKDRSLMHGVLRGLTDILSQCKTNRDYFFQSNPSPGLPSECLPPLYDEKNQVSKNVAKAKIRVTRSSMHKKSNPDIRRFEAEFLQPKVSSEIDELLSNSRGESDGYDSPYLPGNTGDLQIGVKGVKAKHDDLPTGDLQGRPHKKRRV